MNIKEMKKDSEYLQAEIARCQQQVNQLTVQIWRYEGAVAYIEDNIKKLEEKKGKTE